MTPATLEREPVTISAKPRATVDDLLAMPEDGKRYWLVDGEIVEVGMTQRNKLHSKAEARVSQQLVNWNDLQPKPRGSIHAGEAGVIFNDDDTVGIDLLYLSPEEAARNESDEFSTMIVGAPTLVVEILSPSNTMAIIHKKIDLFLAHGVKVVWLVDTHFRTVTMHRPGQPSVMMNSTEDLIGDPELPGFRVPVAKLFVD